MKRRFLVAYDYGQGGVWRLVAAPRAEAITSRFPELQVVEHRPAWMTDEIFKQLEARVIDVDEPTDLLSDLLRARE